MGGTLQATCSRGWHWVGGRAGWGQKSLSCPPPPRSWACWELPTSCRGGTTCSSWRTALPSFWGQRAPVPQAPSPARALAPVQTQPSASPGCLRGDLDGRACSYVRPPATAVVPAQLDSRGRGWSSPTSPAEGWGVFEVREVE